MYISIESRKKAPADWNHPAKPMEIPVAEGIYRPLGISTEANGPGHWEVTFQPIEGVLGVLFAKIKGCKLQLLAIY